MPLLLPLPLWVVVVGAVAEAAPLLDDEDDDGGGGSPAEPGSADDGVSAAEVVDAMVSAFRLLDFLKKAKGFCIRRRLDCCCYCCCWCL